jgi:plasmid stability protein
MIDVHATVTHMKRMQIQVTDAQFAGLQARAARADRPVAALVRDALDAYLSDEEQRRRIERALKAIGGYRSGLGDVSENHDEYLAQAIEERIGRR